VILVPEQARRARLGLVLLLVGIGFLSLAPLGFLLLPLTALGMVATRSVPAIVTTVGAGLASVAWLVQVGDPTAQLTRAAGLASTVVFVGLTVNTRWSLMHRALAAVTMGVGVVVALASRIGASWGEMFWWLSQRADLAQAYLYQWESVGLTGTGESARQMEALIARLPDLMTSLYPAATILEIISGFAVAAMVARRLTLDLPGAPPQPFPEFRFSEHLGWAAVAAMGIMLAVRAPSWRLVALNVLVVAGVLYAWRGAAVGWFTLRRRGRPGCLTNALIVFSFVFLWQVIIPAIIMLGIVDTGLDIRKRLATPK
jgi:Predicted membrane protein (DUF2232)